jgi:hypothetical protein
MHTKIWQHMLPPSSAMSRSEAQTLHVSAPVHITFHLWYLPWSPFYLFLSPIGLSEDSFYEPDNAQIMKWLIKNGNITEMHNKLSSWS